MLQKNMDVLPRNTNQLICASNFHIQNSASMDKRVHACASNEMKDASYFSTTWTMSRCLQLAAAVRRSADLLPSNMRCAHHMCHRCRQIATGVTVAEAANSTAATPSSRGHRTVAAAARSTAGLPSSRVHGAASDLCSVRRNRPSLDVDVGLARDRYSEEQRRQLETLV